MKLQTKTNPSRSVTASAGNGRLNVLGTKLHVSTCNGIKCYPRISTAHRIDAAFGCTELNSSHGVSLREYGNIILLHLLIMAVLVHVFSI